ncbi:DNA translocase FtsK, partial [Patescibacteria group bacterium]|nr:DNA translocase FtsK [Patescibacteria group bacterium]
ANITARIAFTVASQIDSRTIIDSSGSEKLLGNGDMLYVSSDLGKPRRVQGSFVGEAEVKKVVEYLKSQGEAEYNEEVVEKQSSKGIPGRGGFSDDEDELLEEAKEVLVQAGKASASLLQRRLKVGYARAARLLDTLEEQGVVGPQEGSKPREVFVEAKSGTQDLPMVE